MVSVVPTADVNLFHRRLTRIYEAWDDIIKVSSIVVPVGQCDDVEYCKSTTIQEWLFNLEIPDILMIFSKSSIYFLATKKKIDFLRPLQEKAPASSKVPKIELLIRDKNDSNKVNFDKILAGLKSAGKTIGVFARDKFPGDFYQECTAQILKEDNGFEKQDVSAGIACILAVKEDSELQLSQKACNATEATYARPESYSLSVSDTVNVNQEEKPANPLTQKERKLNKTIVLLRNNDVETGEEDEENDEKSDADNDVIISETLRDRNHKYGIIYLSYVPEGLNVKILREIMGNFGEVGRIYLEPVKNNKKHRTYEEGWIEFQKKRVAKLVAKTLNGTALKYGRKHCKMNGQMWSIKYLHKFKWAHLTEQLAHDKAVRDKKRRFELSQTKKQVDFYQKMIEKSRTRRRVTTQSNNVEIKAPRQKRPKSDRKEEFSDEQLLSSIFKKVD